MNEQSYQIIKASYIFQFYIKKRCENVAPGRWLSLAAGFAYYSTRNRPHFMLLHEYIFTKEKCQIQWKLTCHQYPLLDLFVEVHSFVHFCNFLDLDKIQTDECDFFKINLFRLDINKYLHKIPIYYLLANLFNCFKKSTFLLMQISKQIPIILFIVELIYLFFTYIYTKMNDYLLIFQYYCNMFIVPNRPAIGFVNEMKYLSKKTLTYKGCHTELQPKYW